MLITVWAYTWLKAATTVTAMRMSKTMEFNAKDNGPARALQLLVHFFTVK